VQAGREAVLERERRWSLPVALSTFAALGLLIASAIVVSAVNGDGDAEILRAAYEHSSDITISSILQAVGMALLAAPLVYLFRAAQARSSRVRGQLIGLVVAAPLFLTVASLLNAAATNEAASDFVAGKSTTDLTVRTASRQCRSERKQDGAPSFREKFGGGPAALSHCAQGKIADEEAQNAVSDASAQGVATGFGLGGRLGLAFALVYTSLWGMRTGLLTRFWGSLGIALGAAALLLLIQFTLIWFLYFGLLVAGWVPRGRPPAWAAGEAIPWPTPGEKAGAALGGGEGEPPEGGNGASPEPTERRKRKQRD
jgi:hypothetical protein